MMERHPPQSGRRCGWFLLACLGLLSLGGCTFIENELVLLDQRAPDAVPASADAAGAPGDTAGY